MTQPAKQRGFRMTLWVLGILAAVIAVAGLGLMYAVSQNGPTVLSAIDRISGGESEAQLKATVATGEHPSQKLIVCACEE